MNANVARKIRELMDYADQQSNSQYKDMDVAELLDDTELERVI